MGIEKELTWRVSFVEQPHLVICGRHYLVNKPADPNRNRSPAGKVETGYNSPRGCDFQELIYTTKGFLNGNDCIGCVGDG